MKFADTGKEFDRVQKEAVANKGLVMPNLNSASVEVVSVPMHDFSGTGKQAIDKAKQWASNNIVGQHTAKSGTVDEFTYSIDEKAIDKFLSQSATQSSENLGVHLAVLKSLPTVIDKSIDTEVHADYIKDKGVRWSENGIHSTDTLIHRFYGAVLIDGNIYRTKTTIKEKRNSDNKPYTYEVTKVDLVISGSTTSDALTKPTLEVAKLLQGVEKSYDKGKYLLDESPLTSKGVMESTPLFRIVGEIGTSRMEGAEKVLADLRVAREMENGQSIENAADYYFSQIPENLKVEARKYNRAQDEEAMAKIQANREAKRAWADYIRAHEHLKEWQSLNEQEQKKRIRLATGWERGADGKWRYEIPDERFTPEFIASLEKSSERYKDERTQERYTYIGEIYGENSELLKIYPNLSEVSIRINIHPDNKDEGYFMKGTEGDKYTFGTSDEIAVKATSIEKAQSILTHEIQHAIQHIEGFARGGNVNEFKKKYAELNERVDDYNKKLSKASSKGEKELYAQLMSEKMDVVKEIQSLQDEYGVVGVKPYNNLAGEVEARNTETRKDFTPEQRREKLLQETEDVARAEQIVLRNADIRFHYGWHGSPHSFKRFSFEHIGTGEGAQAYGWGGYFSDLKDIAMTYAKSSGLTRSQSKKYDINKKDNLYKVKIHGDKTIDELNFIRWDKPITESQKKLIAEQAEKDGYGDYRISYRDDNGNLVLNGAVSSGESFYKELTNLFFKEPKATSEFLLRAGIDGIQYPTEFQSKGEYKESYNYVVFDENALEIEEHIQFLSRPVHVGKDADGATVVYGWTENGKVYLVKERLNPETPIHEYSHIWDIALQENNPELWKHGVELLKQTKLWDEVKNDPNYSHLKDDNQVASEVKARLTGKKGAEVFARMQQEAKETGDTGLIAKADKLIHDIKQWLSDTWHWLKETMTDWSREEIERVTLDDFVNMTIADMVKGTPLSPKGEESRNALRLYDAVPSEELAEIKERAISDGTFMKAPNGRPTNLTEKQWLQVRTPAFKEWFGDWELANKLRMINNLAPLTVKGKEISNDEAEIIYKSLLNGKNKLDNREVRFVNSTFGKIIRHKGFDVRQIISQLKEIFDNSVPILSETVQVKEGHKQHSNLKDYHHYLGKISFDGQEYYVRFTVQELTPSWKRRERIGQSQLHNTAISDINIYKKSDPSVTTEDYSIGNDNRDRFVDTKLQEFFEKAREAQENTSKVVDENGEPLVQALSEYMHDIEKLNTSNSTGQSDDIRFRKTSTIGFYSTVEDALEKITQEKGTPEQFKAMLLKNGAKQAEMDWMGWDEEFGSVNDPYYKFDNSNAKYFIRFSDHIEDDLKRGWSSWSFGLDGFTGTQQELHDYISNYQNEDGGEIQISGFNIWVDNDSKVLSKNGVLYLDDYEFRELYPGYWVAVDRTNAPNGLSAHILPNNVYNISEALSIIENNPGKYSGTGDGESFNSSKAKIIFSGTSNGKGFHIIEIGENKENQPVSIIKKADIQQWIDKNRIEVEEVTKSDEKILVSELGKLKLTDDQIQTLEYKMIAYYPEYDYIKSLINGANVYIDRSGVALLDESYIEDIEEYEDNYDKVANLLSKINDRLKKEVIGTEKTEYPQATTFKGKNYKELLLTMPATKIFEKWEPVEIKNSGKYFLKNNRKKYKREGNIIEYPNLAEAELKAKKLNRRRAFHYNAYYKSPHWDEPNVLAHIRFSEIEQNGEKILAIEEIQSDWAQEGKKKGFDVEIKTNAQTNLDNYRLTLDQKYNSNWDSEIITEEEYNELSRLEDLTEESIDYDQERNTTIDDMPFKKTDQWVNLSLRRMMRYAAEHGFDRIAWTTGEMQVDRYDFSKRVDRIEYKVKPGVLPNSKSYSLDVFDKQGDLVKREQDLNEEYIEEIIGKELANKIANGEGYSKGDKKVLSGLDLKVGGEGMKAFYDKIIPSAASKLGKPFGAKVELIEIDGADESILNFPTNEILTVQSLPVTESMKETAMNGVPLFSLNGNKNFTRVDDIETVRKAIQNLQDKAVNAKPLFMYSSEEELGRHLDKAGIPRGAARKALADGNTIGFYDEGRGVVFIDLRKVGSVKEGVATWLHEMGIHAGLRNIIPAEQFDSFMEDIYDLFENNAKTYNENTKDKSSKDAKQVWDAVMGSSAYDKVSKSQKGEEMLAYFGERYSQSAARGDMNLDDRSIFRQIVEKITNLLRKVFGLTPKQLTLEDAELIVKGSIRSMFATGTRPIDSINQVQQEGKLRPDGKIEYKFTPLERAINKAVGIKASGMIEVDGIMRPTTNSEGRPIATTPEGLRNFWRWFSDSEKAKRIEKLKNSSPVELSYSNEKSLPEFRKETFEKAKELRGKYINKDTGRNIEVNRNSLREVSFHSFNEVDVASLFFIPDFIENAILIEADVKPEKSTKHDIKSFDYFVLEAKINGEDYTVRVTISNKLNGESYYDHGLTKIEKGKLLSIGRITNTLTTQELPLSDIKDKRLLSILQVNTSKIVDEQGKPMVLYHGTGSDFNDFRYTQDIGFHFGTAFQSSNIAELYEEGSIMPVYLKINNPLKTKDAFAWYHIRPTMNVLIDSGVISQDEADAILNDKLKSENEKLKDVKKILSEKGYDGILYENVTGEGEGISYIVFSPDQIKSATGNNGNFDQNDFNILRRTITTPLENVVQNAADRYAEDRAIKRTWDETRDQMIQFWKDIDLPIKRLQEEIVRLGGKLSDNSNPYRAIDLAKGRLESLYTRYLNNKFNPVLKAIADILKTGISGADILPYMISKHAIERNPDLRQNEINELVEKFKKSYPNATQDEIDIFRIDMENELRDKDYSGIMPFDKDKEGNSINGFKNPEELARAIVNEFEARFDTPEKKQLLKKLWDANYEAGQETLKIWFDGNSMSKEEYDYQRERYKYFVPLRGWREGPANQLIYHKGEGFSKSLIHAKGRTSLAENPLAYMKSVAFKALTEQVDNEVRREMLNLIIDNVSIPVWCDWQFVQHTLHVPDV